MTQDEIAVGTVIDGKYSLGRKIGEGGMGAVYKAIQLMVDRPVAIKLLHAGLSSHDRIQQRFEVEAKAIGRLHHPNCITLFDFGYSTELEAFYTVMEYVEGDPMHKRVIHGVPAAEAVAITRQIALALDHAHHQGILHRDLKPENIMLARMTDDSELVKVLDFGIARIFRDSSGDLTAEQENRLTRAGEVFGTPAYISPEQARGERDLMPASDLYSLGIMLFEMLEGKLPFWGDTAIDTIMLHISAPLPPITRLDAPPELKAIVHKLMAKDASQRFQSGKSLAEELRRLEVAMEHRKANEAPSVRAAARLPQSTLTNLSNAEVSEWEAAPATTIAPRPGFMPTTPPHVGLQRAPRQSGPMTPAGPPVAKARPVVTPPSAITSDQLGAYNAHQRSRRLTLLLLGGVLLGLSAIGIFFGTDLLRPATPPQEEALTTLPAQPQPGLVVPPPEAPVEDASPTAPPALVGATAEPPSPQPRVEDPPTKEPSEPEDKPAPKRPVVTKPKPNTQPKGPKIITPAKSKEDPSFAPVRIGLD